MKQISLRVKDELAADLDKLAGDVPRERYIRSVLQRHVDERKLSSANLRNLEANIRKATKQ